MALQLTTTTDGAPALAALRAAVRAAKRGDPLAPVTVVVPTNAAGVIARRSLARAGGVAAVQFLTLFRLAELLGGSALAAGGRRPLSTPIASAAVAAVLAAEPGAFAPVHTHPATIAAVLAASRELRHLSPPQLERLRTEGTPLAADLVRVHLAVHRRLAPRWHDEADLLRSALQSVGPATAALLGPVVVHLPGRIPEGGVRLLARLGEIVSVELLVARSGDPLADQPATTLAGRWSLALPASGPAPGPPVAPVEIVSATDADEEVRAAVRLVVDAAHRGLPLESIAVLWTTAQPYQRIVGEQLAAAGIRWNGPSPVRLAERLAGRTVLGLLQLDRFGLRRTDLFAFFGNAPIRRADGHLVPAAAWERVSRAAGVAHGEHWDVRLAAFARLRSELVAAAVQEQDELAAGRARRELDAAAGLATFVAWLREQLGEPDLLRPWTQWVGWTHRMLARLLGGDHVRRMLPADEQEAFDRTEVALDRLRELDGITGPVSRTTFADTLAATLDAELLRSGRLGDGVMVGPLSSAVGLDAGLVVVLGLAEGALPAAPPTDPLLTESDRRLVAPILPSADDRLAEQRRHLVAALAAAPRVVCGVPRGDLRRSCVRGVSPWLDELVPPSSQVQRPVASFVAGMVGVDFPATPTEHRVRALLAHARSGQLVGDHPLATTDAAMRRAVALVHARAEPRLTAYDGDLSGLPLPSPFDAEAVMSPTRLEAWVTCPHRYLLQYLLRVPEPDDLDVRLSISPLDRGNVLHAALDDFLRRVLDDPDTVPAPDEAWSPARRALAQACLAARCDEAEAAGLTGRPSLWARDRRILTAELDRWLLVDDHERATRRLTPIASERAFGLPGADWPSAAVVLPSGRVVHFRGSIDRLDRMADGRVLVTDHKTGSPSRFKAIKDGDEFVHGSKLQLAVYAAAVAGAAGTDPASVVAEYSFTRNGTRIGYAVTPALWERFTDVLEIVGSGIAEGLFPQRPDPPGFRLWVTCPFCDPDGMGTGAVHRTWLRKQADPRLVPFLQLVGDLDPFATDDSDAAPEPTVAPA